MARGHHLNTSIVLAAVHGLSGLFRRDIAQRLVHCAIALTVTAVLDIVTKTMSVAPLLTNNLDNSKQKTSNLLSPVPPPYS